MIVTVEWMFFEEEEQFVPADASNPALQVQDLALLPLPGDVVFISPRSAWLVMQRTFRQAGPDQLHVQLWLGHSPEALLMRRQRPPALATYAPPAQTPGD